MILAVILQDHQFPCSICINFSTILISNIIRSINNILCSISSFCSFSSFCAHFTINILAVPTVYSSVSVVLLEVLSLVAFVLPGRCTAALCVHAQPCRSPPLRGVHTVSMVQLWMVIGSDWTSGWGFLAWGRVTGRFPEGAESDGLVYILIYCPGARPTASSDRVETSLKLLPCSSVIEEDKWHHEVN